MKTLAIHLLFVGCAASAVPSQSLDRPNVVLFMADDMGMGDTSAYQDFTGNSDEAQLHTPQMDRLARLGLRFTDAHTPSSRCTPTRYGLLTGRYPWRARMKHWVLFGVQGDPLIERDRPTLATLFRSQGYATAMVGKWHLGLRYRRADGKPAAGWADADLTQPLFDGPCDHGFDFARYTSRSHGTSGPDAGTTRPKVGKNKRGDRNAPNQSIGPGHLHERRSASADGNGKQLHKDGPHAYDLHSLGSRHLDHALGFLRKHLDGEQTKQKPFFLYYPSNSNHGPYTPDKTIAGVPVAGAARSKAGKPMGLRYDYVYENDVALGLLLNHLSSTPDPRRPGHKLLDNTVVIFTSDNGSEIPAKTATGPFRSNKGSCYEGGHRVPFLVSWPAGGVGDGNPRTPGKTGDQLIGLHDLYATFSEIMDATLPDLRKGETGAEDSRSLLPAWRGEKLPNRPAFYNDHKEGKDGAASALRMDDPKVAGKTVAGNWKLFFDASLLREGKARPTQLYDLATDPREQNNRLHEESLKPLVKRLVSLALLHRNAGGHRHVPYAAEKRVTFDWTKPIPNPAPLTLSVSSKGGHTIRNSNGLGVPGRGSPRVDSGEALALRFQTDVLVESIALRAGPDGACGGFVRMGTRAPLAIYCIDADNDAKDQQGVISDLGILKKGERLILDAAPHLGAESPGSWNLQTLTIRPLP